MKKLKQITQKIKERGGIAWIVGGFPRDLLMGQPNYKDIDVEVYGIQPDVLETILMEFGAPKFCGKSFGVYKLDNYDFSFPRREFKNGTGHKGFDIEIDPFMSYEEACSRRDLTINAMMMDPITEQISDYCGGHLDLEEKILCHVSDKFVEDPLRVFRVAQFMGRFDDFKVSFDTFEMCNSLIPELRSLPKERLYTEIEKLLMKAKKPSRGFTFLYDVGALKEVFPELYSLYFVEQGKDHHAEGTVFAHTMLMLDSIPIEERTMTLMLAILVHDMGKMVVENEVDGDSIHFRGHAEETWVSENFLYRLTDETKLIEDVLTLTLYHMRPYELKDVLNKRLMRRLALKVDIPSLMRLHQADLEGRGSLKDTSHIPKFLDMYEEIKNEIKPLVTGKHLMESFNMKPGKHFGPFLKHLFEAQLDGKFDTVKGGIEYVNTNWLEFLQFSNTKLQTFGENIEDHVYDPERGY